MKVRGVYDGEKVVLLEPVSLPPNTPVEVVVPDEAVEVGGWEALAETGVVTLPTTELAAFSPIAVEGEPLSNTILRERR